MTSSLTIEDKNLQPIREVVAHVSYSKDYVTRLAREGKINARWIGRQWFVELSSLKAYEESAKIEQSLRKQKLSIERKQERELRDMISSHTGPQLSVGSSRLQIAQAVAASVFVVLCALYSVMMLVGVDLSGVNMAALFPSTEVTSLDESSSITQWPQDAIVPHFTISSSDTATKTTAIVLLPDGVAAGHATVTDFFSDHVTAQVQADGTRVLVVSDDVSGVVLDQQMPFVAIPIAQESTVGNEDNNVYE